MCLRNTSEAHFRDSAGIQTRNLLIRSQMLYSVKLRNRTLSQTNKENWFSMYSFELTTKRNLFIFDVDSKESSKRKLTLSWRGEVNEVNQPNALSWRGEVNEVNQPNALSWRGEEDEVNLSFLESEEDEVNLSFLESEEDEVNQTMLRLKRCKDTILFLQSNAFTPFFLLLSVFCPCTLCYLKRFAFICSIISFSN